MRRKAYAQPMKLVVMARDEFEAKQIAHEFIAGVSATLNSAVLAQSTPRSERRIHLNYSTADIARVPISWAVRRG